MALTDGQPRHRHGRGRAAVYQRDAPRPQGAAYDIVRSRAVLALPPKPRRPRGHVPDRWGGALQSRITRRPGRALFARVGASDRNTKELEEVDSGWEGEDEDEDLDSGWEDVEAQATPGSSPNDEEVLQSRVLTPQEREARAARAAARKQRLREKAAAKTGRRRAKAAAAASKQKKSVPKRRETRAPAPARSRSRPRGEQETEDQIQAEPEVQDRPTQALGRAPKRRLDVRALALFAVVLLVGGAIAFVLSSGRKR